MKREDEEHFGDLREAVLERDGKRCRVCDASGRDKRSIIVSPPRAGYIRPASDDFAVSRLCKGASNAVVMAAMPPLLLKLWREQHPKGYEQTHLNFKVQGLAAVPVRLFEVGAIKELCGNKP